MSTLRIWNGDIALHFQVDGEVLVLGRSSATQKINVLNCDISPKKTTVRGHLIFPSSLVAVSFIGVRAYIPSQIFLNIDQNGDAPRCGGSNFHVETGGDQISHLEERPLLCFEKPVIAESRCFLAVHDELSGHELDMRIWSCQVKGSPIREIEITFREKC